MSRSVTEKRTHQIILRVSKTELSELHARKTRPALARWLRETALAELESRAESVKYSFPPEVVRTLSGVGNNLNQIARNINAAAKYGELKNLDAVMLLTQLTATERALNQLREYLKK